MKSDEDELCIKIVELTQIYNFVVDKFFDLELFSAKNSF
jgi:hypothetical protein